MKFLFVSLLLFVTSGYIIHATHLKSHKLLLRHNRIINQKKPPFYLIKKQKSNENNNNRHTPNPLGHKNKNKDDDDNNSYLNSKNIITEHDKQTIHLPRNIRKKKYGILTAWTERSDIPGDYDTMPIQHPPVTIEAHEVLECADAPEDYYDDEDEGGDGVTDSTDRIIQKAVKKFSKFDFTNHISRVLGVQYFLLLHTTCKR